MRTTARWAFWRRVQYFSFFGFVALLALGFLYFNYLYAAPTCFDGKRNGDELGIDCGGGCERICAVDVNAPSVLWARSFKIADGQYNAVAYVENRNQTAATPELAYTFSLYDAQGLIVERTGTASLPPDSVYPIFEGRILTGGRIPTRTFLDIEAPDVWIPAPDSRGQFTVVERTLSGADLLPRLEAVVRNNGLEEAQDVEVVATIFDKERNALTSSRTVIEYFPPRTDTDIVFTWPLPIAKTVRSCEIPTDVVLAIDLSGSMNDDGGDPPQPVSSVVRAAEQFVSRLRQGDQVALVTFATEAALDAPLTTNISTVQNLVANLTIAPEAETGSTNTGDALARAREALESDLHNEDARKVLVLLTDGRPTAPDEEPELYALEQASSTHAAEIEVYAIGLGENVNFDFIKALADDDAKAYQALNAADIDRIYQNITGSICEDGAAIIEIIPKIKRIDAPTR